MIAPDPFDTSQKFVMTAEGGFTNNPHDPGGPTMLGVTKHAWEVWMGHTVTIADMKALTAPIVAPFYKATYWRPINADKLPPALALLVYQFAVNGSVKRAAQFLQEIVGAEQDGDIGSLTCVSVRNAVTAKGITVVLSEYADRLREYYHTLSDFPTFGTGWLNRVGNALVAAKVLE